MAKRISTSQLKSKLRQAERKIRKDVNDYNRAVNKYNSQLKRAVDAITALLENIIHLCEKTNR